MQKEKKLISLKEAAEISGYSSDYVGQLIRAGKIYGEQVYSNVVWMTTEEEILAYKNKSKKTDPEKRKALNNFFTEKKRQLAIQFKIFKVLFENFRGMMFALLVFLIALIILVFLIFNSLLQGEHNIIQDDKDITSPSLIQY